MVTRLRMNQIPLWSEERSFTKWLANNIDYVGNIINRNIVRTETEVKDSSVHGKGKYPVDILAVDENNEKIIIENQYFLTNHIHLGELLTYSAWHKVSTIVWITEDVDEEHFRAVEYIKNLAHSSNPKFEFWLLLVSPDNNSDLENNPKIILKTAVKDDCIKKGVKTVPPQNANLNTEFWDKFESVFDSNYYGFSLTRAKRTDCISLSWHESYAMNIPFRKNDIKIEVHFKKNGNIFLDAIEKDFEAIEKELHLETYDKINLIHNTKTPQIRVEIPAQVINVEKWDEYIRKMIRIIVKLKEIVDRYKFCY